MKQLTRSKGMKRLSLLLLTVLVFSACSARSNPSNGTPTPSASPSSTSGSGNGSTTAGAEASTPGSSIVAIPDGTAPAAPASTPTSPSEGDASDPTSSSEAPANDNTPASPEGPASEGNHPEGDNPDTQGNNASGSGNAGASEESEQSVNAYLIRIDEPENLAAGETVVASEAADLDGDGLRERIHLVRDAAEVLWLQVQSPIEPEAPPIRRQLSGPAGEADVQTSPVVSEMMPAFFTDGMTREVAIGFSNLQYGDTQWAIYRYLPGEPLRLMRTEPFAVDTGIIALRDEDGDGRMERLQYPGHVVHVHKYVETNGGFVLVHARSFSTETFDWTRPDQVAHAWLYLLYNRIEPDYTRLMGISDAQSALGTTAEHPDIFTPYPSWEEGFAGDAYLDGGALSWQGLPSAEAEILQTNPDTAVVRLSHVSDFNESRRASLRLFLTKGPEGAWHVARIQQDIAATLCVATDEDNEMVIHCTPVYLSAQEAADGYLPLREALAAASGIQVSDIRQEGSALMVDLPEAMRLYLNQGSTGAAMRINTLARTLLSLPGAHTVRFTIAGEENVEMDHYSFRGAYRLDADRALQLVDEAVPVPLETTAEGAAEAVFAALAAEDMETLSRYAHPTQGVTLAIYGYVPPDAPVFSQKDWLSIPLDTRIQTFGAYDGSGFPIQETAAEWLHMFFVPEVGRSQWDRSVSTGMTEADADWPTADGIWPDATRITYYWGGSAMYDGMDWRALTIVLAQTDAGWRVVGIVSNQWTI